MSPSKIEVDQESLLHAFNEVGTVGFNAGYETAISILEQWSEEADSNVGQLFTKIAEYMRKTQSAAVQGFIDKLQVDTLLINLSEDKPQ